MLFVEQKWLYDAEPALGFARPKAAAVLYVEVGSLNAVRRFGEAL